MMKPKQLKDYMPLLNTVSDDLLSEIIELRDADGTLPDLTQNLYNWSMEGMVTGLSALRSVIS